MKEIKDYLHFYIGANFVVKLPDGTYSGRIEFTSHALGASLVHDDIWYSIKPLLLLRPLSDMTDEEMDEVWYLHEIKNVLVMDYKNSGQTRKVALCSERTKYLLSKGFDLFGLIEEGLAIDKTKI